MADEKKMDWASTAQLILSAVGALGLLVLALLGGLVVSLEGFLGPPVPAPGQGSSGALFFTGMALAGFLLLPSAIAAAGKLFDFQVSWLQFGAGLRWLILFVPPLLGLGELTRGSELGSRTLLPLIHVLVNGMIVFWMIQLVKGGLREPSAQRFWGVFGGGLFLSPLLALGVEFLLLAAMVGLWYLYLLGSPDLLGEIQALVEGMRETPLSSQVLEEVSQKVLFRPGVIGSLFLYIAVLVPVVEEVLKPAAVYLLLGKDLDPGMGFLLGSISGAGYALFENLALAAAGEAWLGVIVSRFGTTAVHILTTGLVGWGVAQSRAEGRPRPWASALGAAVLLHGVWNGINVLLALETLPGAGEALPEFLGPAAAAAPLGLIVLALGSLGGIILANLRFKRAIMGGVEN